MRKGDLSLEFIVSLVILTVAALTIIGIFTTVVSPPDFECEVGKQKVISTCSSKCSDIKTAKSSKMRKEAMFEYCTQNFNKVCSGEGDLVSNIYVQGSGYNSFCRDKAFCFNYPQAECMVEGESLNPQNCLEVMCSTLADKGVSSSDITDRIKTLMSPGDCELVKGSNEEIVVETWWEKYYKNPDCSGTPSNDEPEEEGDCDEVCSSGALKKSCMEKSSCMASINAGAASSFEEGDCPDGKVCCCF